MRSLAARGSPGAPEGGVVGAAVARPGEGDDHLARREWPIRSEQLDQCHGFGEVVVALARFAGGVGIVDVMVHPNRIGILGPNLD